MIDYFIQQLISGLVIGSTYAVVAIGFSLIFTVMRTVNFAHPDVFMVGMFSGLIAGQVITDNIILILLAGAVGSGITGILLERLVLRPLRKQDILMGLIATLGVSFMLSNGMAIIFSPDPVPFPELIQHFFIFSERQILSSKQALNLTVACVMLICVSLYVRCTRYGRATRALAEKPDVAEAFGVDTNRVAHATILLASVMAGLAAVSVGTLYSSAYVYIGTLYGLKSFICMLVAGNRYFEGVMVIALLLGILEVFTVAFISSAYKDVAAFSLLIAILFFFPQGIFGSYEMEGRRT